MIKLAKFLTVKLWQTLLLVTILIGITAGTVQLLAPSISSYRSEIATWAGDMLAQPVQIGDIALHWRGFGPRLVLRDVALLDAITLQPDLQFAEVQIDLSLLGAFTTGIAAPRQVTIVGAELMVKRRSDGSILVDGLNALQSSGQGDRSNPLQLLPWRLGLQKSVVHWENQAIGAKPVRLDNVRADLTRDAERYQLDVSLDLPDQGGQISLAADLRGELTKAGAWVGKIYVKGKGLALATLLKNQLPDYNLERGAADVELWSSWSAGRLDWIKGQIGLSGLHLTASGNAHALDIEYLRGRMQWQQQTDGWQFDMADIEFLRPGQQELQTGISLIGRYGEKNRLRLKAGIAALELADLQAIVGLFPLPVEDLAGLHTRAGLEQIQIDYEETATTANWFFSGQINNLWMEPWNDIPGMKNITAKVEINQERGAILLASQQVELNFSSLFRTPLKLDNLAGLVQWQQMQDGGWRIQTHDLAASNKDIQTSTRMLMDIPAAPDASPILDLQTDFKDGDVSSIYRYLPIAIMDDDVVAWLDRSLVSGHITSGSCVVRGSLQDFPYMNHKGRFEVLFGVEDLLLDYFPGWPQLDEVATEIRFLGAGLDVWIYEGKILNTEIKHAYGRIDHLADSTPLKVKGAFQGPLKDNLRMLRETPLAEDLAATVSGMRAEGHSVLEADFAIPLTSTNPPPFEIDGRVDFNGSTLHFDDWQLSLTQLQGDLLFDQNGIQANGIQALALNTPVTINLGSSQIHNRGTNVTTTGLIPSTILAKRFPDMGLDLLDGAANWSLQLDIPPTDAAPETPTIIAVASDLQGVAVNLPAPMGKPASEVRHFQLTTEFSANPIRPFQGRYGDILDASLLLEQQGSDNIKLRRGELRLGGDRAQLPDSGMRLYARLDELDTTPWLELLETSSGTGTLPTVTLVDAEIQALRKDDLELSNVMVKLEHKEGGWNGRVASNLFDADVFIPLDLAQEAITLRLDQIELTFDFNEEEPEENTEPTSDLYAEQEPFFDPRDFPAFYLQSDRLILNDQDLGAVILDVRKIEQGLLLEPTIITSEQLTLSMSANWQYGGHGPETDFKLDIETPAIGTLLADLGVSQNIHGAAATITSHLRWRGGPQRISLQGVSGPISIDIGKGSMLEVNPGVGRIFGLLNLTSLQRRLSLDFSDLYKKGFSFDHMQGNFQLEQGDAYTENFQIDGPAAKISISGRAGLVDQDLDQQITVAPQISSSVTLATAIANPVAGAAMFVAQSVMGDELDKITSYRYQVTGSWDDPVFSKKESILLSPDQQQIETGDQQEP
ncbi:FIG005080: Possible exported protein [hydrothermal vent metagenome]|uniref:FIG005080: Possible exported protein n=1 Tax=hydrothermal vent metagenome TaxID=652676 RepID=A0A3B1AW05_9ZZZZ